MLDRLQAAGEEAVTSVRAQPRLSVVIPVYNEVATIAEVVRRVQEVCIEKEILIVDDGSTDGTRQALERLVSDNASRGQRSSPDWTSESGESLPCRPRTAAVGRRFARGFQEARGEIVIIQDRPIWSSILRNTAS